MQQRQEQNLKKFTPHDVFMSSHSVQLVSVIKVMVIKPLQHACHVAVLKASYCT